MITNEEKQFIRNFEGLPKSLIEKKIGQLKEDLVNSTPEDFQASQKFIRELQVWLNTIKVIKKEKRRKTKEFES